MRISDWSSDVCSSDLVTAWDTIATTVADNDGVATVLASRVNARTVYTAAAVGSTITIQAAVAGTPFTISAETTNGGTVDDQTITLTETQENEIGRASCRERGCQYV